MRLFFSAVPKGPVDARTLHSVSGDIGKDWASLGRELSLTDSDLDNIRCSPDLQNQGLREIAYQMLRDWHERLGNDATKEVLAKALVAIKRADIAKKLSQQVTS
jgi:hypothetical protein